MPAPAEIATVKASSVVGHLKNFAVMMGISSAKVFLGD
jgi:hypothetical protein